MSCSFPTLKETDIKFIRLLSGHIILAYSPVNLTSFKAKDDFKWEQVVIKNLEQEAEALTEDRNSPCSQHTAGNLVSPPQNPTKPKWGGI